MNSKETDSQWYVLVIMFNILTQKGRPDCIRF